MIRMLQVLLAVALVVGCSAPVRPYTCATDPQQAATVDPHLVWRCNRDVLHRVVRKRAYSLREFRASSAFFEQLAGLEISSRGSHLGALPSTDVRRDLVALDAWYALHRTRLRWDSQLGKVVLAPLAAERGPV